MSNPNLSLSLSLSLYVVPPGIHMKTHAYLLSHAPSPCLFTVLKFDVVMNWRITLVIVLNFLIIKHWTVTIYCIM